MLQFIELSTELNPVELYSLLRDQFDFTYLLESMEGPEKFSTQSLIGFAPLHQVRIDSNQLYIDDQQTVSGINNIKIAFHDLLNTYKLTKKWDNQFVGGLVGFTSYDIIRYIEDLPQKNSEGEYPNGLYGLYLDGIRYNHQTGTIQYFHHDTIDSRLNLINEIIDEKVPPINPFQVKDIDHQFEQDAFEKAVKTIKEAIIFGETFQTVLSQRINFTVDGDPIFLYQQLRESNPSPYMYYLEFGLYSVIGSSPELLVSTEQDKVTTYPIAGTRRLGETDEENKRIADGLLQDEKERAEHNMLVDLARNDIGSISQFNSVEVTEYMNVEYFSHVMHLVSKVEGRIKTDYNLFDAFFGCFPAGTVSGAPKVRSMELIESLEPVRRGPYAGAVGYFGINSESIQAITIRTAFGKGDQFSIQAGAGIVLDSNPRKEYEETLHKLAALLEIIHPAGV